MKFRGFELDPFQADAIRHLSEGRSVLVAAPTGNGKTIIADWIVQTALDAGDSVVYTAPIKALSNQKYRDYVRLHGEDAVGLVTGDLVIRPDAPCRVMTTEILRNMLLSGQGIDRLRAVVVDEIHFLDDKERGTVWEEVLIYLPETVQVVGLSATLSNLDQFAEWLTYVRGHPVEVVRAEQRIVPLEFHYACNETGLLTVEEYDREFKRRRHRHGDVAVDRRRGRGRGRKEREPRGRPTRRTRHTDLLGMVYDAELLPCLYFVFSRKDTEMFARRLVEELHDSLLTDDELARMDAELRAVAADLGAALDDELRFMYRSGVAFHHAGLHVQLKALVESLYEQKLIKVLYCTSTFALGINMPARSVVFDGIMKFDGNAVAPLTTRGFMQKAGRAGRRGLDPVGYVIVRVELEEYDTLKPQLERYLRAEYEPVRSSFNLAWNSIVNLLDRLEEPQIRAIVDKSFLSWRLSREANKQSALADELEQKAGDTARNSRVAEKWSSKQLKEAKRLRKRAEQAGDRVWQEFEDKVRFLQRIGYIAEDRTFNAGAKVLMHLQIAEILVTELVLSGVLETLDPAELFGVLCSLTNDLGRDVMRNFKLTKDDRRLAREVNAVRHSEHVVLAEDLSAQPVVWCPDLIPVGRAWARGQPLEQILRMLPSRTDISGDLITGFRRAKDLAGQLTLVYAHDPARRAVLRKLVQDVNRDEMEVID